MAVCVARHDERGRWLVTLPDLEPMPRTIDADATQRHAESTRALADTTQRLADTTHALEEAQSRIGDLEAHSPTCAGN